MQVYRVYVVNLNGHSADSPQILERADNDAAISHARQCLDGKPIEVWQGPVRVARLEPEA
jgi:hypothetical protein